MRGESPYTDRMRNGPGAATIFGFGLQRLVLRLRDIENGKVDPEKVENTIITIPSNELSRARGGSHCMTCPIEREDL